MSVVATFTFPADEFALGDLLEVRRGIRIRLVSIIPTGSTMTPYFWVSNQDADAVGEALRDSPLVTEVRVVDETETETLFRVDWAPEMNGLFDVIEESNAVLLSAEGLGDRWSFRAQFPEHEDVSDFYRTCIDEGFTPELETIHGPFDSEGQGEFGITASQREALLVALEKDFFAVPRQATLEDLAEELGISDTAVSQRIRRGLTTLLSATILEESTGERIDDESDD